MIKLPEPVDHQILFPGNRWGHCTPILFEKSSDRSIVRALYTEAQLKQYGRDLLEEAAKVCDKQVNDANKRVETLKSNSARDICSAVAQTAHASRMAIRALIKEVQ